MELVREIIILEDISLNRLIEHEGLIIAFTNQIHLVDILLNRENIRSNEDIRLSKIPFFVALNYCYMDQMSGLYMHIDGN